MTKPALKHIELFTDGACLGNPGPGGWAALLRYNGTEKQISGAEAHTTNNRMELQAVIEGLRMLKQPCSVKVTSDSQYVLKGLQEWMKGWKARGWKTADKKPVKNQDLWMMLDEEMQKHSITYVWVKGHNGHRENEIVDVLAQTAAREIQAAK